MRTRGAAIGLAALPLLPGPAVQPAHEGTHEYGFVDVVDADFEPTEIVIPVDARVRWRHQGAAPHDIHADDGSFSSHPACTTPAGQCMRPGETYEHEFNEPGRYPYHCRIHGGPGGAGMSGVVVVQAEEPPPTQPTPAPEPTTRPQPTPEPARAGGGTDGAAALPRSGPFAPLGWAIAAMAVARLLRNRPT